MSGESNRNFKLREVARLRRFISLREDLRLAKVTNRPWAKDNILKAFRFCNVSREHDRVTLYVAAHYRHYTHIGDAVTQLLYARIFNEPATLQAVPFFTYAGQTLQRLEAHRSKGHKLFRGAYLMPPHHANGVSAPEYWCEVLEKVSDLHWNLFRRLGQVAEQMKTVHGLGDFIVNQICTDLRYCKNLPRWDDWGTFVLCGPGTKRGLNRLCGEETKRGFPAAQATSEVLALRDLLVAQKVFTDYFADPNNIANCLCEYDKYSRVKEGSGRLKPYKPYHAPVTS